MPRIAIHIWRDRVAPVFDTGGRILILTDQEEDHVLTCPQPALRADELVGKGVGVLICGAISRPMHEAIVARGIRVIGFVAGEVDRVAAAWKSGGLDERFAMPGCRGTGLRRGCRRGPDARANHEPRRISCHAETERDHKDSDHEPGEEPGCARTRSRGRRTRDLESARVGDLAGDEESAGG
jgi:predicted Fe-Mo cluster-binding NifX family protein